MTLQQLRFLIAVAESGSINAAAQRLYTAQSNISNAVKSLEQELHIEIFTRSSRGVALTNDGTELLGYARQVVEQADMLEARYEDGGTPQARLAISAQHYAFSVEAFVNVVERCRDSKFEFIMRETTTAQIIDDVRAFRSDIGILYLDDFNTRVLQKAFTDARASFHPLFDAKVHVFVSERHRSPVARSCPLPTLRPIRATALSKAPRTPSITPRSRLAIFPATAISAYPTAGRSPTCLSPRTAMRCRPAYSPAKCSGAWPRSPWQTPRRCMWATSCMTTASPLPSCSNTSTSSTASSMPTNCRKTG